MGVVIIHWLTNTYVCMYVFVGWAVHDVRAHSNYLYIGCSSISSITPELVVKEIYFHSRL